MLDLTGKLSTDMLNHLDNVRELSILGSTGSVGRNTIAVLQADSSNYKVRAITANENVELLAEQALTLNPEFVVIGNKNKHSELKTLLSGSGIKTAGGEEAIMEAASLPVDWTMAAIVGAAGLKPVL